MSLHHQCVIPSVGRRARLVLPPPALLAELLAAAVEQRTGLELLRHREMVDLRVFAVVEVKTVVAVVE